MNARALDPDFEERQARQLLQHADRPAPSRRTRGTSNRNERGSTKNRRRRRAWLLMTFASDIEGACRCYRCGRLLYDDTITVDRIVPGAQGGTYKRNNIRPACARCNSSVGATVRSK